MASRGWARRLAMLALACAACGPTPGPAPLPKGLAELRLPADSAALARTAHDEEMRERIDKRRETLANVARQLLMGAPPDVLVPEQFDFLVALAPRMESGAVDAAWGSYLYTTYLRDMQRERPDGRPRRGSAEIGAVLDRWIEFYQIRANPRLAPSRSMEAQGFDATREYRDERRQAR